MRLPRKTIGPSDCDEAQDGEAQRRLAGAGFADDAHGLASAHPHRDAVDRLHMADGLLEEAALDRKPDLDRPGIDDDRCIIGDRIGAALRLGGEQPLRVGVLRIAEDLRDRSLLDDLAFQHHADAVGDLAHDAEIVGDEEHRHVEPALQLGEQLQDLRLHRHVERRGRLVGDEEVGLVGERHGDHHALALAARELVRIGAEPAFRVADADEIEKLERAGAGLAVGQAAVQFQDLADLPLDGVERIERGHRLLEHHGDVVAAHLAHLVLVGGDQVLALEQDAAGRVMRGRVGQELEDREGGDGLAGAGFAHQRHRLARHDVEGDAVHRQHVASALAEGDGKVLNGEEGFGHRNVFRGSKASRTASPMKMRRLSMMAITKKPESPSHGA